MAVNLWHVSKLNCHGCSPLRQILLASSACLHRFGALLRCFCQQLTWTSSLWHFNPWQGLKCDKLCVFGSGSAKCPPNWGEVAHCFQWHDETFMSTSLYCPNSGWFLLWIILEVFDYRGHDGTADSWTENDSSAFAATPSIDKWWWRQHWWLVSDWLGLHQDAINHMAIALADICHLTFWTGWNLFSQWFQSHPKKLEKKATQRTLLPLVPHYQMKSLSSLLIKINIFDFMSEIMKAIGIKDNLYAHTAPIHSLQTCFQPGDGGSSFAGPYQGQVTKGVLAWSINGISHQPNI